MSPDDPSLSDTVRDSPRVLREEAREVYQEADDKLAEKVEQEPALEKALDWRTLLGAPAIALVVAVILKLLGVPSLVAFAVFLVVLLVGYPILAKAATPRRPTSPPEDGEDGEDAAGAEP